LTIDFTLSTDLNFNNSPLYLIIDKEVLDKRKRNQNQHHKSLGYCLTFKEHIRPGSPFQRIVAQKNADEKRNNKIHIIDLKEKAS
jgi:hypothetical protein